MAHAGGPGSGTAGSIIRELADSTPSAIGHVGKSLPDSFLEQIAARILDDLQVIFTKLRADVFQVEV